MSARQSNDGRKSRFLQASPQAKQMRNRSGVSLLEIIVAVIILSLIAATVGPSTHKHRVRAMQGRTVASEVATMLRAARTTAIGKQRSVVVQFGNDSGGSWFSSAIVDDPVSSGATPGPLVMPITLPTGAVINGWPGRIVFDSRGIPDRGLDLQVGTSERTYRLVVYAASGLVRLDL